MSSADEAGDRIEREILINAPIERVWRLVSEPGWWIGDGERSGDVITREGTLVVVDYPPYGQFPIVTVAVDVPRYASFRSSEPGQLPEEGSSTLVEFFLAERNGGTVLRVVESGFASLGKSAEDAATAIEENSHGWEQQLGFAKRDSEHVEA